MKKESVNMDQEFREKLASREIAPSPQAWDRLDAMLNVAEQKKEKPVFRLNYWLVAAAISAIVLGIAFFLKPEQKTEQKLVDTEKVEVPVDDSVKDENGGNGEGEESVQPKPEIRVRKYYPVPTQKYLPRKQSTQIAEVQPKQESILNQESPKLEITHLPAQVQAEQLLAENDKPDAKPKRIRIDSKELLSLVDGELEYSFRERVLISIDQKFQKAKTAVANRNNQ